MNPEQEVEKFYWAEADISEFSSTDCVLCVCHNGKYGHVVGFCTFDKAPGKLEIVRIEERYRRRGLATGLVRAAEKVAGKTLQDTGARSAEGTALLKSMGQPMCRLNQKINPKSTGAMLMFQLGSKHIDGMLKDCIKSKWTELPPRHQTMPV